MNLGKPGGIEELSPHELVDDVEEERASILIAARSAQNIAMLTGTYGVVSPPLRKARARLPLPEDIHPGALPDPDDDELGRLRAFVRARAGDPVGELRARLELAAAELARGHRDAARIEATAAAGIVPNAPAAHAMLRAFLLGRDDVGGQLEHVARLAAHAASSTTRADWLCETARLLEARGGDAAASLATWTEALALAPDHAGALYGAEVAFERSGRHSELAVLLDRLSALAADPAVSAWLHVERALVLDRRLSDVAGARAALERALELSPGIGPVRDACVDHAVLHRDDARLAALLEEEAALENDRARAARLELDAALAGTRAGLSVLKTLERAHGRAPTSVFVDARVAEELARRYEAENRHPEALRVLKAALAWSADPREELLALRAIASAAERAGEFPDAILALERARVLDPEDASLLDDLDALLVAAARHDARSVLWTREAARIDDPAAKAHALLRAADAAHAAGREAEASKTREVAWLTAPSAPGVYDAVAGSLAPVAGSAAIRERVALYEQALEAMTGAELRESRIHLLEKIAWLEDDVAGDAAAAARVYEKILAIQPTRASAIAGLASAARRSGDDRALARALLAHAEATPGTTLHAELRLQAAGALAVHEPERALVLAEEAMLEPALRPRASEVVTRLHLAAERFERAAETLATRANEATVPAHRVGFALAEFALLLHRLHAPERALAALARLPKAVADDPAVRAASFEALEHIGDEARLREALLALADETASAQARVRLLVRRAELDENQGRDAEAVASYEWVSGEPLVEERLRRLGARVALGQSGAKLVSPRVAAVRALETESVGSAEPLLATGARDVATLRVAERLARRTGSAPQLANALALLSEARIFPARACEGLASLVAWTLPPGGDDYEPWADLLALGTGDAAGLDTLVARAAPRVLAGDPAAIRASILALERRVSVGTDDTERLMIHLALARLHRRAGLPSEAAGSARRALDADPTSLTAACFLAELAAELGDDEAAIRASCALADVVVAPTAKAELLRDAADLSKGEAAAALLERALRADPEGVQIAARLADLQRSRKAFADLARALKDALARAHHVDAVLPIASELADVAKNELKDPRTAIAALERIREVSPAHVPSLFLLAELFIGQRAWDKALEALAAAAASTSERGEKLVAIIGRASIYRRILQEPASAERELRAALETDAHDPRAIRGLLDLGVVIAKDERAALLGRLVIGETSSGDRLQALVELADARRAVGDTAGAEGALVEAASLSPDPAMLARVRAAVGNDHETLARVLSRAVARAHEGGRAIDPGWLIGLGAIEVELGRLNEAIERFEEALRSDDSRDDARVALAKALAARGRHEPAAAALLPVIVTPRRKVPIDAELIQLLESSLSGAGRATEYWVARELRAVAGDLAPREQAELDARMANLGHAEGLSASALRRSVMPGGFGRHPVWDVAALASGLAGKLARVGLAEQGSSTRDRVKAGRAHPVRPLFDRMLRAFELTDVELAVSEHVTSAVVAVEDVAWLVVPSSIDSFTDAHAVAALARPMTRIALGIPWLGPVDVHEVLALLVAFARQVAPNFTAGPEARVEPLVADYELRAKRAIDRRRRRALEELSPSLERVPTIDAAAFAEAVHVTEVRAAFLLSGSLRATLDAMAPSDRTLLDALRVPGPPSLGALFGQPSARDLASFALQRETTTLRRSLGTA